MDKVCFNVLSDFFKLNDNNKYDVIDGKKYELQEMDDRHEEVVNSFAEKLEGIVELKEMVVNKHFPWIVSDAEEPLTVLHPDIAVLAREDEDKPFVPVFVAEITSPGGFKLDYIYKLKAYADAGVKEYWIINPYMNGRAPVVITYTLEQDRFDTNSYCEYDAAPSYVLGQNINMRDIL